MRNIKSDSHLAKKIRDSLPEIMRPKFRLNHFLIEIDITYKCNLNCYNCDRSCRQASDDENMTVSQIKKFVKESKEKNIKWVRIRVLGGEPTLHPRLIEILDTLIKYKNNFSPKTQIMLVTNGFGEDVNNVLNRVPEDIIIENTHKISTKQPQFCNFNIAPVDSKLHKYLDYSKGCFHLTVCGMGLTKYGYYPCAPGGGIDRVFGFDIARKKLPSLKDSMEDQLLILCKFCGWAIYGAKKKTTKEEMSPSWLEAYRKYMRKKPKLAPY